MNNPPIVLERTFNAPVSKVWKAITDKDEMKNWYFDLAAFKAEVGFKFQFSAGKDSCKPYMHLCEVTEVIKEKKLTYSWRYDAHPGISFVTFELFHQNNNTLLRLTHTGIETFATDNPDFAKESFSAGWTHLIHTALKAYVEAQQKSDYQNSITVHASPKEVYACLHSRITDWWTDQVEGSTVHLNDRFTVRFGNTVKTFMVEEAVADEKLVWHCTAAFIDSARLEKKNEWIGTKIIWEILPEEDATRLLLTHQGLTPEFDCYDICEKGWDFFLTQSLYQLLTTSKGLPYKTVHEPAMTNV